ncbi:putative transcription factor KAN2 isoform X3 [Prunus yedoensis var. nudiflora]|uniref:Putative transcription factor KAN2 isoform X3 n=1 Tax=Prunus yedoensis var. nudiflora TaxID=2094558 RepID=A0A314ZRV9_PRUYE|nr:putative transcription factor KAN2 isoform X3 [Prunus yedoensis var. nudiflora]
MLTTDKAAPSSEQSDVYENASSGDTTEDIMLDLENPRRSSCDQLSPAQQQQGSRSTPQVQDNKEYYGLWSIYYVSTINIMKMELNYVPS